MRKFMLAVVACCLGSSLLVAAEPTKTKTSVLMPISGGLKMVIYRAPVMVTAENEESTWNGTVKCRLAVPMTVPFMIDLEGLKGTWEGDKILRIRMPVVQAGEPAIDTEHIQVVERTIGLWRSALSWEEAQARCLAAAPDQGVDSARSTYQLIVIKEGQASLQRLVEGLVGKDVKVVIEN